MSLLRKIGPVVFVGLVVGLHAQADHNRVAQITSALRAGKFEQAVQLTNQALATSPNDSQLWTLKGIGLSSLKRSKEALDAYHRALKISPNYLPALEGAAQIEYEAGDKEAVTLLRRIAQLRPGDPTSHAMLGALAYKREDCADAVQEFESSEQLVSTQPAALQQYGTCLLRLKRNDKALSVFQRLLATHPDDPRARRILAMVQFAAQQPQEALATLRPLLETGDPDVNTLQLAASAYEANGDTPDAVKTLRDAIVKDPRRLPLYIDFANLAFAHQSFQAGIEMIDSGLELQPEAAPLYLARGVLYVQVGEFEKAEADFDLAEQLDPTQAAAGIAQGLAAIAECRAALKYKPKDQTALYRLVVALRKADRKAEIPDLLKRLAEARQEATRAEAENNRYKLVIDSGSRSE